MTFGTKEKEFLEDEFSDAFKWVLDPSVPYNVVICDFMQWTKHLPKDVLTLDDLISHFKSRVHDLLFRFKQHRIEVLIVCVDGKPIDVKRMVAHVDRYANKNVMEYDPQRPRLPLHGTDLIPSKWIEFAGNYQLLQRELYPLLFNAFMFECTLGEGQRLILSGFPGRSRFEDASAEEGRPWEVRTLSSRTGQVWQVQQWSRAELPISPEMEAKDPNLYHRVYVVENVPPCPLFPDGALKRFEWEEAKNDVSEADLRIVYFEHWFQNQHIIFCINDGDIFSIGLLYAQERHVATQNDGKYVFRNQHTVMIPYKETDRKKKRREERGIFILPEPYHYVDLNVLYQQVKQYRMLSEVRFPVASFVFLIIMSRTDFFKDFLKGMTAQTIIWKVFFENAPVFKHLIQYADSGVARSTRDRRFVVIDEDAFRKFIIYCYLQQHEPGMIARSERRDVTFDELRARSQRKEDTSYHMPSKNMTRTWCRQVEWNFNYWTEGVRGRLPDPYQLWNGMPYYPYYKIKGKPTFINMVSPRPRPVDRVYEQHFVRNRKRRKNDSYEDDDEEEEKETPQQAQERKKRALEELEK